MDPIVWTIVLLALGMALVIMEIFIPSGGILGFLAVCSLATSIGLAFYYKGPGVGFAVVGVVSVGSPIMIVVAFKYWPRTAIGRRVLLGIPKEKDVLPEGDPREQFKNLIGEFGSAKTAMRPGGTVAVHGKTYEAVSEGTAIDAGDAIEVVRVRNNRLVVRKSDTPPPSEKPEDMLSRPIDTVGLDPFEDPLA